MIAPQVRFRGILKLDVQFTPDPDPTFLEIRIRADQPDPTQPTGSGRIRIRNRLPLCLLMESISYDCLRSRDTVNIDLFENYVQV